MTAHSVERREWNVGSGYDFSVWAFAGVRVFVHQRTDDSWLAVAEEDPTIQVLSADHERAIKAVATAVLVMRGQDPFEMIEEERTRCFAHARRAANEISAMQHGPEPRSAMLNAAVGAMTAIASGAPAPREG